MVAAIAEAADSSGSCAVLLPSSTPFPLRDSHNRSLPTRSAADLACFNIHSALVAKSSNTDATVGLVFEYTQRDLCVKRYI